MPQLPYGAARKWHRQGDDVPGDAGSILEKADRECIIHSIGLINWTEPTLHPKLGEMVRIAKKYCKNVCGLLA